MKHCISIEKTRNGIEFSGEYCKVNPRKNRLRLFYHMGLSICDFPNEALPCEDFLLSSATVKSPSHTHSAHFGFVNE